MVFLHGIYFMKKYLTLSISILGLCTISHAQWNPSPSTNNLVCSAANDQQDLRMTSDGRGGAIITWVDFRNDPTIPGVTADIFVQRIDNNGTVRWTNNGVAVCTDAADQTLPVIVPDGQNGAIIAWQDWRSGNRDIYAQRIDSSGNVLWNGNGVAVVAKTGQQRSPRIASDNAGGAIVVWEDSANGNWDVYAQRMNSAGVQQWTNTGVGICTSSFNQINPKIVTDLNANAFITWQDGRNGNDYDIYVQMLNGSGTTQWTVNGLALATGGNTQSNPKIALDFGGMIIVAWQNQQAATNYDVFAQRISSAGAIQWTANGVVICNAAGSQSAIDMTTENVTDGALITWKDGRTANVHIYCQKVNFSGVCQWTNNGVLLSNAARVQVNPNIVSDGFGGAIVAWQDSALGIWDIFSQRITSVGSIAWTAGGVAVGNATNNQTSVKNISDGLGGSIYAFQDKRSGEFDIYAYRLDWAGMVSSVNTLANADQLLNVFPNPNDGTFRVELDGVEDADMYVYDGEGELVAEQHLQSGESSFIHIGAAGIYEIETVTASGTTLTKRVVVTR